MKGLLHFAAYRTFLLSRRQIEAYYGTVMIEYSFLLLLLIGFAWLRGLSVPEAPVVLLVAGVTVASALNACGVAFAFAFDYPVTTRGYCRYLGFTQADIHALVFETGIVPNLLSAALVTLACWSLGAGMALACGTAALVSGSAFSQAAIFGLTSPCIRVLQRAMPRRAPPVISQKRRSVVMALAHKDIVSASGAGVAFGICFSLGLCVLLQLLTGHPGLALAGGFSAIFTGVEIALFEEDTTCVGRSLWHYYAVARRKRVASKMLIPCAFAAVSFVVVCLLGMFYSTLPWTPMLMAEAGAGLLYCLVLAASITRLSLFYLDRSFHCEFAGIVIYLLALIPLAAPVAAALVNLAQRKESHAEHL